MKALLCVFALALASVASADDLQPTASGSVEAPAPQVKLSKLKPLQPRAAAQEEAPQAEEPPEPKSEAPKNGYGRKLKPLRKARLKPMAPIKGGALDHPTDQPRKGE